MLPSKFASLGLIATVALVAIAPTPVQAAVFRDISGGAIEGIDPFLFPGSDGTFTSTISVSDTFTINASTGFGISIFGLAAGDAANLSATLKHVTTGTTISLFDNLPIETVLDGAYTFNDAFSTELNSAPTSLDIFLRPGFYNPDDALSAFFGESVGGDWELSFLNTSSSDAATFTGWQMSFNMLQFVIEGTLAPATIPEYSNAFFRGVVEYPKDAADVNSIPDRGSYEITNFLFEIVENSETGETEPFAFLVPDPDISTQAFLDVSSRTYRIGGSRVSNHNSVCIPERADVTLFFNDEKPEGYSDEIDPDPVPLTAPPVNTFVPGQSSVVLFGDGCGDDPNTPEEEGSEIPVADIDVFEEVDLTPPTQPVPEPASVLGLGIMGSLGWLIRKQRNNQNNNQ